MYIAAVQIADEFGCDAIGIQYQQGLKDMVPASDLVEGLLNNADRPPVRDARARSSTPAGRCRISTKWTSAPAWMRWSPTVAGPRSSSIPSTTLHDVRWGEHYSGDGLDDFVWVLQISGAAPASHFVDGYRGARSERQPPMYFPLGGGTLKGIGKPGEIVWSRVFVEGGACTWTSAAARSSRFLPKKPNAAGSRPPRSGRSSAPPSRRLAQRLHGAASRQPRQHRLRSDEKRAAQALAVKAAMFHALGVHVHLCGAVRFA